MEFSTTDWHRFSRRLQTGSTGCSMGLDGVEEDMCFTCAACGQAGGNGLRVGQQEVGCQGYRRRVLIYIK